MLKSRQRHICLQNRKQLTSKQKQEYSQSICDKLFALNLKGSIMSYYPSNNEVDIRPYNLENEVSYPVILTDGSMDAYLPKDNDFILNYYKIYEPNIHNAIKIDKENINYILIPCVGFDAKLNRIGHGKAYYDRFLKGLNATKIGLAFDIQKVDEVFINEYDIPLDFIITESNFYKK